VGLSYIRILNKLAPAGFFYGRNMERETERQFLNRVLRGQSEAIDLCMALFRVSQIIDDLHDRDRPVERETLHRMAWQALVEIPSNGFYQHHFIVLQPLIRASLADWLDSTALETGSHHERTLAFVLRDSLTGVVVQCAYLIGGYDWMRSVSVDIRTQFHDETQRDYLGGLPMQQINSKVTA